jgi:hypothetical protein
MPSLEDLIAPYRAEIAQAVPFPAHDAGVTALLEQAMPDLWPHIVQSGSLRIVRIHARHWRISFTLRSAFTLDLEPEIGGGILWYTNVLLDATHQAICRSAGLQQLLLHELAYIQRVAARRIHPQEVSA